MFIAKFKYEDSDRINYIYVDHKNKLVGFSIDGTGIKSVEKEMLDNFVNLFRVNDDCVLVTKENGYDVYLNSKTKFKHYIKNGREDFLMFFKNNGTSALSYEECDSEESLDEVDIFDEARVAIQASLTDSGYDVSGVKFDVETCDKDMKFRGVTASISLKEKVMVKENGN